jgi:hypothetical protein
LDWLNRERAHIQTAVRTLQQQPVIFRKPAAGEVQNLDWLNRGRAHIETAIRTLASVVNVPLIGTYARPKHSSKSELR